MIWMAAAVAVASAALSFWLASSRSLFRIVDVPNERSLHSTPTPRTGGIAILLSILGGWSWLLFRTGWDSDPLLIVLAVLLVAGVSLLDDLSGVRAVVRLAVHGLAAAVILFLGVGLPWSWTWVATVVSFLFIVWMINLYNFMDGMDGFASGMTVFGFGAMAVAGWFAGTPGFTAYTAVVALAAAGFLVTNFPPAKLFMGDIGSATLGLLAATFALLGVRAGVFPLWYPLLVFSPFIVDATFTLLRRMLRGEKFWEAHRTHCYQQLVQLGWGHRKTVLHEYVLMLLVVVSALALLRHPSLVLPGLALWGIVFTGIILAVLRRAKIEKPDSELEKRVVPDDIRGRDE